MSDLDRMLDDNACLRKAKEVLDRGYVRDLDEILALYGAGSCATEPSPAAPATPTTRRNAMPTQKASAETRRRLESAASELRELTARANRRFVEAAIDDAVAEGRIAGDERERWLERAEKFGVDVVRDLLREHRADRRLAAANAAASTPPLTEAEKRELAAVFPSLKPEDL